MRAPRALAHRMHYHAIPSTLLLIASLTAQTHVFAPANAGLAQPATTTQAFRDSTTGFRSQFVYDSSIFLDQGVTTASVITRIRFRVANATTSPGGSYPGDGVTTGVTIDVGTSLFDHAAPSTFFGGNRGTMVNVMTLGTLVVQPATGSSPGAYVVDVPIPAGFLYDPTLGQDLLIDVTGPDFVGTLPALACQAAIASGRCSSIAATNATSATGSVSANAPVALFDLFGTGGLPSDGTGSPILSQSTTSTSGSGCGPAASRTVAEQFGRTINTGLDLGSGIVFVPDLPSAPTRYSIAPDASSLRPRGTNLLVNSTNTGPLGDDQVSGPLQLPFVFPYVGGSTSVIHADSNGYVVLSATTVHGGDSTPSLPELQAGTTEHSGLPRACPCWYDFHGSRNATTHPGAGIYFDVDPANGRAWVTWENVGEFAVTTPGTRTFTFQAEFDADGTIVFRYGPMTTFGGATVKVVGFTPGSASITLPSIDLSAAMPFTTAPQDLLPLELTSGTPRIGSVVALSTRFVPVPGLLLQWLTTSPQPAAIDLAGLGMTGGCSAYVDPSTAVFTALVLGSGTVGIPVAIPEDLAFVGLHLFAQSACPSGYNAFGMQTSNLVSWRIGTIL